MIWIVVLLLLSAVGFFLLMIISIAWTHKPISVWQMVKEELRNAAERKSLKLQTDIGSPRRAQQSRPSLMAYGADKNLG